MEKNKSSMRTKTVKQLMSNLPCIPNERLIQIKNLNMIKNHEFKIKNSLHLVETTKVEDIEHM